MKSLIRNINVLNILLTAALTFFMFSAVSPLFTLQVKYALPEVNKQGEEPPEQVSEIEVPSPAEFMTVSDQNLFHPERKIPIVKKEEQPLPKPDLVLYGTLITDTVNLAYVEDLKAPRSSPGRGKRQTALKQGDRISGFTLQEIHNDTILLKRGDEKLVVSIQDPLHPKERTEFGIKQPASAVPPASAAKSPPLQRAPQRAIQPASSSSPEAVPPRPDRRPGSQKTFRPQASGR